MIFSAVTCDSSSCACPDSEEIPGDFGGDSRISSPWVLLLPFGLRALKMFSHAPKWGLSRFRRKRKPRSAGGSAVLRGMLLAASVPASLFCSTDLFSSAMWAQQTDPGRPVVVQPGAPGKPSRTLPPSTRATLPPRSQADVEFMQGMIMHHSQAVEMTALIATHTENKELRSLGARISSSQSDEIKLMQRWLAARGERISVDMPGMDMSRDASHHTSG